MEEEQKVDLPLNGELDIKSSDMLVSVNDAKFAHNRQRWQGHCLPSSLRYEHDGWAAGWDVYNLNYTEVTTDVTSTKGVLYKIRRYYYNDNKAYSIAILSADDKPVASFVYNMTTVCPIGVKLTHIERSLYSVTFTVDNRDCTFIYDTVLNTVADVTEGYLITHDLGENCKLNVIAKDIKNTVNVDIKGITLPSSLQLRIGDTNTSINIGVFDHFGEGKAQWVGTKYTSLLSKNNDTYTLNTKYNGVSTQNAWADVKVALDPTTGQFKPIPDADGATAFNLRGSGLVEFNGTDAYSRIYSVDALSCTKVSPFFTMNTSLDSVINKWDISTAGNVITAYLPMHISIVLLKNQDSYEYHVLENSTEVTQDYLVSVDTDNNEVVISTTLGWLGQDTEVHIPLTINPGKYAFTTYDVSLGTFANGTRILNITDLLYTNMEVTTGGIILDITRKGYIESTVAADNLVANVTLNEETKPDRLYIDRDRSTIFTIAAVSELKVTAPNAFVAHADIKDNRYYMHSTVTYDLCYKKSGDDSVCSFVPGAYKYVSSDDANMAVYTFVPNVSVVPEYDENGSLIEGYDSNYKLQGMLNVGVTVLTTYSTFNSTISYESSQFINEYTKDILPTVCSTMSIVLDTKSLSKTSSDGVTQSFTLSTVGNNLTGNIYYEGNKANITFDTQSVEYNKYTQTIALQSSEQFYYGMLKPRFTVIGSTVVDILPFASAVILDSDMSVSHADRGSIVFSDNVTEYTFLYHEGIVSFAPDNLKANNVLCINISDALYKLSFNYTPIKKFILQLEGPTAPYNCDIAFAGDDYNIALDDDSLIVSINSIISMPDSKLDFIATDIRDEDLTEKSLARVKQDEEYQIIKQHWDTTTKTEQFWWLDSTHVLTLDKFKFSVLQKTDEVDDWSGDKWETIATYDRVKYINSDITKYFVTSVYGEGTGLFCTMRVASSTNIVMDIYNMLDGGIKVDTITLTIVKRELNTALIDTDMPGLNLYTYTALRSDTVLSQAKISSTLRNGVLLLGIHFDNNFNQWTAIYNIADKEGYVLQGYGFVGPDGSLTGGEIPSMYFGDRGFSGTVNDINTLGNNKDDTEEISYIKSLVELQNINANVYGNDVQQWYIAKNISSIISHITCIDTENGIELLPQELFINNNYNVVYSSSSFASQVLGDANGLYQTTLFDLLGLKGSSVNFNTLFSKLEARTGWYHDQGGSNNDLFDRSGADWARGRSGRGQRRWKDRICNSKFTDLENFPIYDIRPLLSNINYLQQTIGQYAYVHYNNSNVKVSRNITTSANENNIDQTLTHSTNDMSQLEQASLLRSNNNKFARPVGADELAFDTQVVRQVQGCAVDWPRQFLAILAVGMSALDFTSSLLQLNKSNNQVTIAGMHNSSQLMAQALNSLALSGLQPQQLVPTQISEVPAIKTLDMFYSTSSTQHVYAGPGFVNHNFVAQCTAQSVTSLQLELKQEKLEWVIKLLTEAENMALASVFRLLQSAFEGMLEIWSTHNWIGSVMAIFAGGCAILAAKYDRRLQSMESILNALGGDRPRFTTTAAMSKHTYDVEGKHKYGNSSKSFMWPCFGCDKQDTYTDEYVSAVAQNKSWRLDVPTSTSNDVELRNYALPNEDDASIDSFVTSPAPINAYRDYKSDIAYYIAMCKGNMYDRQLPVNMAYVIGTESFLSKDAFKNENVGEDDPVFTAPLTQDYMLSARWELGVTATAGEIAWVSVRDTKIIDGEPSNIIISPDFCGVASTYTAIEVKRGLTKKYMRPVTITPTALALNCTGYNSIFDEKAYHGFDGYGGRIVSFVGAPGMGKEHYTLLYTFLTNDRFKRSNKIAPNQLLGNFKAAPVLAMSVLGDDKVYTQCTVLTENQGMLSGVPGEDKDILRYALPVFSEHVNTLPAATKTLSTYTLAVVEGVTSLCTDIRNLLTAYKVPVSIDFNIGQQLYRVTQEYICSITNKDGAVAVENLVPILGLSFLGASPYEAYFYSQATKLYYVYTGGTSISAVDTVERFRDVQKGYWDFVNQEVVLPCVATFDRLDSHVHDDADETDNIIIPILKDQKFKGEVPPPVTTIFNTDSWYKVYSLPSGVAYQGPNRCIINRFVWSDYMLKSVRNNRGKWSKVLREAYHPFRKYNAQFESVTESIGTDASVVKGWTHNPFLLVTSPLGVNEETDCKFEWEVTFAWTVEMDKVYGPDEFACVNIVAETMEPGGKVYSRPSHVYLTKELFTRTGNYGYYSFRYQSGNGIGNRERLHIWADSYIAVSSVQCAYKPMTTRRTEILTQQIDVKGLTEM